MSEESLVKALDSVIRDLEKVVSQLEKIQYEISKMYARGEIKKGGVGTK